MARNTWNTEKHSPLSINAESVKTDGLGIGVEWTERGEDIRRKSTLKEET
jgi:hypothetical protein